MKSVVLASCVFQREGTACSEAMELEEVCPLGEMTGIKAQRVDSEIMTRHNDCGRDREGE